jgi:tetrahydromethanopterin S-methyltransferase subunit B
MKLNKAQELAEQAIYEHTSSTKWQEVKYMKWTTSEMQDVIAKALVKNLSLCGVVDKLKDRNDKLSELSKDLIRKIEKKIPYISLPEDEGLYTALHKLKNEVYKSL